MNSFLILSVLMFRSIPLRKFDVLKAPTNSVHNNFIRFNNRHTTNNLQLALKEDKIIITCNSQEEKLKL